MTVPRILQEAPNWARVKCPRGSSTALEPGDLISYESNAAVLMDAVGEDATFLGYCINRTTADFDEPDSAVVGLQAVVEYDATSATLRHWRRSEVYV